MLHSKVFSWEIYPTDCLLWKLLKPLELWEQWAGRLLQVTGLRINHQTVSVPRLCYHTITSWWPFILSCIFIFPPFVSMSPMSGYGLFKDGTHLTMFFFLQDARKYFPERWRELPETSARWDAVIMQEAQMLQDLLNMCHKVDQICFCTNEGFQLYILHGLILQFPDL